MAERVVMEKLQELSGFPVVAAPSTCACPGRLNEARGGATCLPWRSRRIWEARTGQVGYFLAPVTVAGRYRGLAFQAVEPGERGYPPDQIELFCEAHLRAELGLDDGDLIAVWLNDG